jgi:hypothetical protein
MNCALDIGTHCGGSRANRVAQGRGSTANVALSCSAQPACSVGMSASRITKVASQASLRPPSRMMQCPPSSQTKSYGRMILAFYWRPEIIRSSDLWVSRRYILKGKLRPTGGKTSPIVSRSGDGFYAADVRISPPLSGRRSVSRSRKLLDTPAQSDQAADIPGFLHWTETAEGKAQSPLARRC